MTDNDKLEAILKEISTIFHLNSDYIDLIRENVLLRAKYYRNIKPDFSDEIIYINNSSNIMDFFLNRLINNVRDYQYNYVYNPNTLENEEYSTEKQLLKLSSFKTIGDIAQKKLENRLSDISKDLIDKVNRKIISHEFGHLFQTSYSGTVGKYDTKYKELITNLNKKYPETFIIPNNSDELILKQNGLIPTLTEEGKNSIREYYANKERIILLDDIFNEDESLQIYNIDSPQGKYDLGNNCYKNIYNFESINFKITTYARMMKLILGSNMTFKVLYKDGIEFYEFFDRYEKYATEIFKNGVLNKKPVVSCILDALERIKKTNSLRDAINLDIFFTKCLENRVRYMLNNNASSDDIKSIKMIVNEFITITTRCKDGKLEHQFMIDNIKKMIDSYR